MQATAMTIEGEPLTAADTFGVIKSATGRVLAEAPECTRRQQLDEVVEAAARRSSAGAGTREPGGRGCAERPRRSWSRRTSWPTYYPPSKGSPCRPRLTRFPRPRCGSRCRSADLPLPRKAIQDDEAAHAEVVRRPFGRGDCPGSRSFKCCIPPGPDGNELDTRLPSNGRSGRLSRAMLRIGLTARLRALRRRTRASTKRVG